MKPLASKIGLFACVFVFLTLITTSIVGCKYIGRDTAPPSKWESAVYNVVTNYTPVEVKLYHTNFTDVEVPAYRTNVQGVIEWHTNIQTIQDITWVPSTNMVAQYIFTPKDNVSKAAGTAGEISNYIVPGSGGLIAGIITGAAALYGKLRSSKRQLDQSQNTSGVLVQNVQTLREFVKSSIPNGQAADDALTKFLQKHQAEEGVLNDVLDLIEQNVSKPEAKAAVLQVRAAMNPTLGA